MNERHEGRRSVSWASPPDPISPWVGWKRTHTHNLNPSYTVTVRHIITNKTWLNITSGRRLLSVPLQKSPALPLFTPPSLIWGICLVCHLKKKKILSGEENNQGECLMTGSQKRKTTMLKMSTGNTLPVAINASSVPLFCKMHSYHPGSTLPQVYTVCKPTPPSIMLR